LTDLAKTKLTTFYGNEDSATLKNVLQNVPNVVPQLLNFASNSNWTDNKTTTAKANIEMFADAMRSHNSAQENSSRDDAADGNNSAATVAVIHPDKDGAYVNPVITDSLNPDTVEDSATCRSTVCKISKERNHVISEQDCTSANNGSSDARSRQPMSSSREDALDNSTLHKFLRMVSTQSSVIVERLESRDEEHTASEVICVSFLFLNS